MKGRRLFSSGNFAKLSRTSRSTLHLYDSIGLLPPKVRGQNNYRYYSAEQLATVNFIRILQEFGMSLDEMTGVKKMRTPEYMEDLLVSNIGKIDKKIDEWVSARKLLLTLQKSINSVMNIDEKAISIQYLPLEAIILGDMNDFSNDRDDYSALLTFYEVMQARFPELNLNYPVWGKYSEDRVREGDWQYPDHYYFYNPEGHDKRPSGLYAVGYKRGRYGDSEDLFQRMVDFVKMHKYELCGDTYEEYPLNEFSIDDESNYLIRIMMGVQKKSGEISNNKRDLIEHAKGIEIKDWSV